jgi:hypothetical protein
MMPAFVEAKLPDAGGYLSDLRVRVRPRIPGPRDQLFDQPQLDLLRHRV